MSPSEQATLTAEEYALCWGRMIRELRERAPFLSQEELARQVGITQSTLSRIERGVGLADIFVARAIAKAMGLHLDYLNSAVEEAWARVGPEGRLATSRRSRLFLLMVAIDGVIARRWAHLSSGHGASK